MSIKNMSPFGWQLTHIPPPPSPYHLFLSRFSSLCVGKTNGHFLFYYLTSQWLYIQSLIVSLSCFRPFDASHPSQAMLKCLPGRQGLACAWPQPTSQFYLPPLSLTHSAQVTLAIPLFPQHSKFPPTSGPFHLLLPLPRLSHIPSNPFPQAFTYLLDF